MKKIINKTTWWIFGSLCVMIGLYPLIYFLMDRHFGLLSSKSQELLANLSWNIGFYGHIILGGLALLVGWTQFSSQWRKRKPKLHRNVGKLYIIAVLISGTCGIYIAQFATGGISNVIGFSMSGTVWLLTTILAYQAIRKGQLEKHQNYMIYSYAVCFSAVTLRFWLPILTIALGEFQAAYLIVGWLSWVPNLVVAYFIIQSKKRKPITSLA
ncbi:DUF2306 domain-containing protein [Echinicola sp. CAU 1574]|uniref:DUF2306 domain-containing protein n=1 Tax=Echinicola arenosa TaxID=2774144 RepID=A0ABR9AMY9_9BACT|nr:DUF2306 domain-containing protein [Echinicola arenosa]MBD8490171.1 DUF2306 domain-containing protein [Echinicola arenosa]